jgi:hypothetical protein
MINNVTDGVLLDVRGLSLSDLGSTALDDALARILSSNSGCNFNSFNSRI